MREPRPEDDLYTPPPAADQAAPGLNGAAGVAAITGEPPPKRPRTKGGRFALASMDTVAPEPPDPPAVSEPDQAPRSRMVADDTAPESASGLPTDNAAQRDRAPAGAGERVVFTPGRLAPEDVGPVTPIVGSGLGATPVVAPASLAEAFPDLRRRAPVPVVPWHLRARRLVREATRPGKIEAEHDARIEALLRRIATRPHIVGVIGPKGGAGKSTTALLLGLVLAQYPSARPVLCEVNPDWGTLAELLGRPSTRTVVDVLRDYTAIDRAGIGLLQGYQTMFGRLPVLTGPKDPEVMACLAPRDYDRVLRLLAVHYGLLVLDCGTSFTQVLNQYAIRNSDHLVVVGWPEQATMRMTLGAVEYLASSRYERDYRGVLAESARAEVRARTLDDITLVVNGQGHTGRGDALDPAKIRAAAGGLNATIALPYAPALRRMLDDGTLTIEALPTPYRRAAKELLVAVLGRLADAESAPPGQGESA